MKKNREMPKKPKGLLNCVIDFKKLYLIRNKGILYEYGWWESLKEKTSINADGNPLPWITYPCIEFLSGKIEKSFEVFEYGSGHSTLWWAERVSHVVSIEYDKQWFDKTNRTIPENVTLLFRELDNREDYSGAIAEYTDRFDILMMDGVNRVRCVKNSLGALKDHGVIVWDDSQRERYEEGYDFLESNGFRRVDFWGIGPIRVYKSCTSIFYRDDNCLKL